MAFLSMRQLTFQRALVTLSNFRCIHASKRTFASQSSEERGSRIYRYLLAGALFGASALTWAAEELETRRATLALVKGSKIDVLAHVPGSRLLERAHTQNRLVDLLQPYVCSMEHVDIVHGHCGTGKTTEIQRACNEISGGVVYVDLEGKGDIGARLLQVFTGELNRSLAQRFRDVLRGGREAHGIKLLELAVLRYLQQHDRYPVVVFDHVDPENCNLGDPVSPLLQLGRKFNADAPSLRTVLVLDDYSLEALQQGVHPSSIFRTVAIEDATLDEALDLLQQHNFPRELAQQVSELVGGRLSHLQEAVSYWLASPRWLSPMRPGTSKDDYAASIAAHFSEIKKIIYWDLDKRLRISAGIALWPSATGDAPVPHQTPTDEDAVQVMQLLRALNMNPVPASTLRSTIGEPRVLQLLKAQIVGFVPQEGPLHKRSDEAVTLGSPALRQYFIDRLAEPKEAENLKKSATERRSWTSFLFSGS